MKRTLMLLIFLFIGIVFNYANYVKDYPTVVTQPDGTTINCFITGDEFHRRLHDVNGYTFIEDPQTGFLVYAILENDELVSSGYRVGEVDPASVGLVPGIDISGEKYRSIRQQFYDQTPRTEDLPGYKKTRSSKGGQNNGTINNIVIYVRFSDQTEFDREASIYEDYFNRDEDNFASMYRYFKEVSDNQTFINSTFYPERTGTTVVSYQDTEPRSYFLPYSSANPNGYLESQRAQREHALLARVINAVRDQIPDDIELDFNNDDLVDNICFIIRGNDTGGGLLWPHKWQLYSNNVILHGLRVWTYNIQLEGQLNWDAASVLCHEMFHTLGAPDLYHYETSSGDIEPIGRWDLMSNNINPPQSTSAYMRHEYGGWIEEIPEITRSGTYTLNNIWSETNKCYKIKNPNADGPDDVYFVVEYRNKDIFWDSNIPGTGLVIYRVDPTVNEGNRNGPPDEVFIYRPNNISIYLASAFFAGNVNRRVFNSTTSNPRWILADGTPVDGVRITDVSSAGETISFDIEFDPIFEVSPENVDFGNVSIVDPSSPINLNVRAKYLDEDLTYQITGADATYFQVNQSTWSEITGGVLEIVFSPDEVRSYNATLEISSVGVETKNIPLTGEGVIIPVVADFTSDKGAIWVGETVNFADASLADPVSWSWTFEGGVPSTSTEQNPVVTYNNAGLFSVSLTVTNQFTTDEKTVEGFISVSDRETTLHCNGGFEYWNSGRANCWFGTQTTFSQNLAQQSEDAYEGNYSLKLLNNLPETYRIYSTQPVYVTEDVEYEIKFYAKGGGEIIVGLYDGRAENNGFAPDNEMIVVNSDTWVAYSQIVTAVETTSEAEFLFKAKRTVGSMGHLLIDNVEIKRNHSDVNDLDFTNLSVYPNPSTGLLYIDTEEDINVKIYSLTGILVMERNLNSNDVLNLEKYSKGIYLMEISNEKGKLKTHKLILQ